MREGANIEIRDYMLDYVMNLLLTSDGLLQNLALQCYYVAWN